MDSYGSQWKFSNLVQVGGSLQGYMEALGSFHQMWLWKVQLIEASGSLHSHHQCDFPCTSIEASTNVHGSKLNSMEASTNLHGTIFTSIEASMEEVIKKVR